MNFLLALSVCVLLWPSIILMTHIYCTELQYSIKPVGVPLKLIRCLFICSFIEETERCWEYVWDVCMCNIILKSIHHETSWISDIKSIKTDCRQTSATFHAFFSVLFCSFWWIVVPSVAAKDDLITQSFFCAFCRICACQSFFHISASRQSLAQFLAPFQAVVIYENKTDSLRWHESGNV